MEDGAVNKSNAELEEIWLDRNNPKYLKVFIDSVHEEMVDRGFVFAKDGHFVDKKSLITEKNSFLDGVLKGLKSHARSYVKAAVWTGALTAIFMAMNYIPLPTVNLFLEGSHNFWGKHISDFNILLVGLYPVINAFGFVEFLSLFVTPLSRWRLEGTTGRGKLNQCAWTFSLLFSFANSFGNSFLVKKYVNSFPPVIAFHSGLLFHFLNVITLMAGTYLAVWLARVITKVGVGNGFLILSLAAWLKGIFARGIKQILNFQKFNLDGNGWFSMDLMVVLLVLTVIFLWKFIQKAPKIPMKRPDGKILWFEISPLPQSAGIHSFAITILASIAAYTNYFGFRFKWLTEGLSHISLEIFLICLFGWFLYNWFWGEIDVFGLVVGHLPTFIKKRERVLERQFLKAMAVLVAGSFLFWVPFGANNPESPFWVVSFGVLIAIFAALQDLSAQWLFWKVHGEGVELLEMDNVHLASYLKGLFQAEKVPCHIQAYNFRRLFFIFSPLYKMRLLVPEGGVDRAKELLATVQYQVV
jgi:preprotein translocase subunit SecY